MQIQSNWRHISKIDLGRLPKEQRDRLTTIKTARQALMRGFIIAVCIADRALALRPEEWLLVRNTAAESHTVQASV